MAKSKVTGPWDDYAPQPNPFDQFDTVGPWNDFKAPAARAAEFDPNAEFSLVPPLPPGFKLVAPAGDSVAANPFDQFDTPAAPVESKPKDGRRMVSAENATAADYAVTPFGGLNRSIGIPADVIKMLLDASGISGALNKAGDAIGLPRGYKTFGGSEQMADTFNKGVRVPDTVAGRALDRIGEEVGAAVLPAAGLLKAAGGVNLALHEAPTLLNGLLRPIAASPGKALAGETVAALGSGTGAAAARELAPDSPVIEQLSQIAGGFAPGAYAKVAPSALALKGVNKLRETYSLDAQKKAGTQAVKDMLGRELTPDNLASLKQADNLTTEIPGFKPSIAEATDSPALIAQQKRIETQASGDDLNKIVARRRDNQNAVAEYAEQAAPIGPDNPELVIDAARGRVSNLRAGVERQQAAARTGRENIAAGLPVLDRADAGGTIRSQLTAERAARREMVDRMASQLGLDGVDVTDTFMPGAQRILADHAPRTRFDDTANTPRVLDEIGQVIASPQRVTFADLKGLRERVTDDLIDAAGSANPSRKQVRSLTQLREHVDGIINDAAQTTNPALAENYAAFRRAYFEDYIRPFEQGAAFKTRALDGRGFFKTTDEKVADGFFKAGDTTAADQFNEIFANRPGGDPARNARNAEARDALRASAIDNMRTAAVRDGVLDQGKLQTWMRQHSSVLDRFPEIRQAVATPALADAELVRRSTQLAGRQRTIEDQMLTRAVNGYAKGSTSPEAVITAALADPRKMNQLMGAARRADGALPALRRNVWEQATGGDAASILKFMGQNEKGLAVLFTPEHLTNIRNVASARAMLSRVPDPSGAAYVPRPLEAVERAIGQGLPQLSSRIFAFKSGRVQKEYLVIDSFLRSLRGRAQFAADDAMRAALYDPQLARDFAHSLHLGANRAETAKKLHARLFALGIPLLDREQPQEPAN